MLEKEKLKNKHYHSIDKGCELIPCRKFRSKLSPAINGFICKTHDTFLCRCGWEFGWHGGENKRLSKFQKYVRKGIKKIWKY